jgi:hypothetical protein
MGSGMAPVAVLLLAGLAAILWPARRRPRWFTVPKRTAVPAALSFLYSVGALLAHHKKPFGPGEPVVLLCLRFVTVRHARPRWALVCGGLNTMALLSAGGFGRGRRPRRYPASGSRARWGLWPGRPAGAGDRAGR